MSRIQAIAITVFVVAITAAIVTVSVDLYQQVSASVTQAYNERVAKIASYQIKLDNARIARKAYYAAKGQAQLDYNAAQQASHAKHKPQIVQGIYTQYARDLNAAEREYNATVAQAKLRYDYVISQIWR